MKIKTHKMNCTYKSDNHFFVLSKGYNAGKPLSNPCPNCFVLFALNQNEREYYFWLCYGLWVGGLFRPFLTGSVIPFIRIQDLKTVIEHGQSKVQLKRDELMESIKLMNRLSLCQDDLVKQIQAIKYAKKALMYKILK